MAHVQTNFTSIDMLDASQKDAQSKKAAPKDEQKPVEQKPVEQPQAEQEQEAVELEVPGGSVDEITEWVGDDKDRAKAALAAENVKSSPRKTLVAALNEVIGD